MRDERSITLKNSPEEVAEEASRQFLKISRASIIAGGLCSIALSGGTTPLSMFRVLAQEPYRSLVDWRHIHLFWVDERCVPWNAPESNYGTAQKFLINHVPLAKNNVHPMPVNLSFFDGALIYEKDICRFFNTPKGKMPTFDLIFLGVGKDGHVASMFPGSEALLEKERLIVSTKGGEPLLPRLTMTFPLLNNSRSIILTVSGRNKAEIMKRVFLRPSPSEFLPIHMVRPRSGRMFWILDRDSAFFMPSDIIADRIPQANDSNIKERGP